MNVQLVKLTESTMSRDSETSTSSSIRGSDSDAEASIGIRLIASAPPSFTTGQVPISNPISDSHVIRNLGKSMDQMSDSFFNPGGTKSHSATGGNRKYD